MLRDARHIVYRARSPTCPKDALIEAMTGEQVNFGFADAAGRTVPADAAGRARGRRPRRRGFRRRELLRAPRRGRRHFRRDQQRPGRRRRGGGRARAPYTPGTIRINGRALARAATCPRRSRSASAACRRAGTRQGLVLTQSVADNTTMTIADRARARSASSRPRAAPRRRASAIRDARRRHRGAGSARLRPLRRQPAEGRDGPGARQRPLGAGADGPDRRRRREIEGSAARRRSSACAARGKAILVVSGELEDLRTCDRVLVMRHGGVVAEHKAGWSDNALVASIEGI